MLSVDRNFLPSLTIDTDGAAAAAPSDIDGVVEPCLDAFGNAYNCSFMAGRWYQVRIDGVGSFTFTRRSTQVCGTPEPGASLELLHDIFRREIVPLVLQRQSWEVLHASGLVVAGECVALSADTRMGKSTLAYGWRCRGGRAFADDAIPFRMENHVARVQPIPFHLRPRLPSIRPSGDQDAGSTDDLESVPLRFGEGAALRSIYLLDRRPGGEGTVLLAPVSPEDALPALLRQAYSLTLCERERNREMMESYIALVNAVPVLQLSYPTGLQHVEAVLDRLEEHVTSQASLAGAGVGAAR